MRFSIGNRHPAPARPVTQVPQYSKYHLEAADADVLISAWQCPVTAPANVNDAWFARNCTLPLENVSFAIQDQQAPGDTTAPSPPALSLELSALRIVATPTAGYAADRHMSCEIVDPGEGQTPGSHPTIRCNWYTWQPTPADITVYAWECPDDYDITADHANPMDDCTGVTNGVPYRLTNSQPQHELQARTGAWRSGAARFTNLEPGEYTLAEIVSPGSDHDTILWQCFGVPEAQTQIKAMSGTDVSLTISGGEHILCHRFHIPHRADMREQ